VNTSCLRRPGALPRFEPHDNNGADSVPDRQITSQCDPVKGATIHTRSAGSPYFEKRQGNSPSGIIEHDDGLKKMHNPGANDEQSKGKDNFQRRRYEK
jgi:hypothetical protein